MGMQHLPREKGNNVVIACKFVARIQRTHQPRNKQGKTCKCCREDLLCVLRKRWK